MHWRIASEQLDLARPIFLGILNITPDSFSDGGLHLTPQAAVDRARLLLETGAALLDIGAESTRPGAVPITPEEEWGRLRPVLESLRREFPRVPLSLDTRHPSVAERGLELGAAVLNDITGFSDPSLLALARNSGCGIIAMRSRMKEGRLHMPDYAGPAAATLDTALGELVGIKERLLSAGLAPERILLDPGFGFGTVHAEDCALWSALPDLPRLLAWPVERFCLGLSRKRFLAWQAGLPDLPPGQRDELTRQAHAQAAGLGYRIFRTHTVN